MSVNLTRRAKALQTLRLPDDVYIPDTSQKSSYRHPQPEKYTEPPSAMSMKPHFDDSLKSKWFWSLNHLSIAWSSSSDVSQLHAKEILGFSGFFGHIPAPLLCHERDAYAFTVTHLQKWNKNRPSARQTRVPRVLWKNHFVNLTLFIEFYCEYLSKKYTMGFFFLKNVGTLIPIDHNYFIFFDH